MTDWDNLVEPTRDALEALLREGDNMAERIEELEAKLAEVEAERDKFHLLWKDACVRSGKNSLRADAAEAALPAVYRLALEDAVNTLPTPTAAELMARIKTGEAK